MRILELPTYISLGAAFLGSFLVAGASFYGMYQLSQTGRHWDILNGYGLCSGIDLNCTLNTIGNMTMKYIPSQIFSAVMLVFLGFGAIAMFMGDQSERVPITGEEPK